MKIKMNEGCGSTKKAKKPSRPKKMESKGLKESIVDYLDSLEPWELPELKLSRSQKLELAEYMASQIDSGEIEASDVYGEILGMTDNDELADSIDDMVKRMGY